MTEIESLTVGFRPYLTPVRLAGPTGPQSWVLIGSLLAVEDATMR